MTKKHPQNKAKQPLFKKDYLKAVVAGLFCSTLGSVGNAQENKPTATPTTTAPSKVHCYGINACRGQADCHTAKNSCSGKNACKGQGWKLTTQQECDTAKGTVKTEGSAKKS